MIEKLKAGLAKLTGNDYERAERDERAAGNNATVLINTMSFATRLASYALDVPARELKALPIGEYLRMNAEVLSFLNGTTDETATLESCGDESQCE